MERAIETITVVGAGAVGGAMAAILSDAGLSVSFLAGGARRERLEREGLVVNGKAHRVPVVDPEGPASPADLVIVAVKNHHLEAALGRMRRVVGEGTIIMSLMNGIDSEERIGAAYGDDSVLPATIVGIDALREGGRIVFSRKGKIFFGEASGGATERTRRVAALFDRAGMGYEVAPDIIRRLWWKFMINVGVNQVSAALAAPYGVFQAGGEAKRLAESAMLEVVALARAQGIALAEADIAGWYSVLSSLSPGGKTSMLQDVEAGRKTEVEMLAGKVIELGRRLGVPTPVNEKLFETITEIEGRQAASV